MATTLRSMAGSTPRSQSVVRLDLPLGKKTIGLCNINVRQAMTRLQEIKHRHKDWKKRVENDLAIMGDGFMMQIRIGDYWSAVNAMTKVSK